MVSVAQLVESRIVIPVVAGSSPVVHPIKTVSYLKLTTLFPVAVCKFVSTLATCLAKCADAK